MRLAFLTTLRGLAIAVGLTVLPGLAAAQACPDANLPAPPSPEVSASLATGMNLPVIAGGAVNLSNCQAVPGNGFVAPAPDYELTVSGNTAGDDLQFWVTAPCDSVLLVNDATGTWYFSDDEDGTSNPRIVVPAAGDGAYDIWVGSYDGAICDTTLSIQTFVAGTTAPTSAAPASSGLCPDVNLESPLLSLTMAQLATPQVNRVVAGGDLNIGACPDVAGAGYVIQSPDFQMDLTGSNGVYDIEIRADAVCDVTLLVNDAGAEWHYNDDAAGTNPVVRLTGVIDGSYDIWVGTLGPDTCDATLTISTVGAAAPVKGQPPVVSATPDPGNLSAFRTNVGEVMSFQVTGAIDGTVYGTENYTDDSDLSTAAVHAGILADGQSGVVTVQMTGPGKGYVATSQNGVDSVAYGKWDGSYSFIR